MLVVPRYCDQVEFDHDNFGHPDALVRQRSRQKLVRGFTLLELMVVVVIASITLGTVAIATFRSDRQLIQNDAQRIALLLQLTREEAILRNRPTAFEADARTYRFLVREDSGWQALPKDDMLRQREFLRAPMRLSINPPLTEQGALDAVRITFGREPVDKPFALTLVNGDISVVIRADGIGHFSVE